MTGMTTIFIGLVCWNTVFLAATLWLALTNNPWHWAAGLVTGIFMVLIHCIVFMHFMGTGKGIKESVENFDLPNDPKTGYVRRTRKFKMITSPHATFAPLAIMVAIWLGGWFHSHLMIEREELAAAFQWHRWAAWLAIAYNYYAFYVEWKVIRENTAMICEINALIAAKEKSEQIPASAPDGTLS